MKSIIISFLIFVCLGSSYASDNYVIKLNKIIDNSCRVVLFSSLDATKFFLYKFSLKENLSFEQYQNDKETFFSEQKNIFSYERTLGTGVSDYSYKLEDKYNIIVRYRKKSEAGSLVIEEAALFENLTCD